jgi:hypothetical protein
MDALRWTHFSPRVGFSFDIFSDGKTSLKGSWSRYNEYLMLQYIALINPFADMSGIWYWFDNNYNQEYDPPPIDTYQNIYMPRYVADYDLDENLDPDATAPYTDEFTIGVERELATDFSLTVTFVYKHKQNIFEDVNDFGLGKEEAWKGYSADSPYFERFDFLDPGDDGEFGTGDDKTSYVYAVLDGAPEYHWYLMNVDGGFRKYWAINVIFNKRMSNNWQLLGSIVYSKAWGNIGGLFGETSGMTDRFDDPNAWIYTPGRLDYDRPWNIKLQSTVILPYDFIISGYFNHLSGFPWGRWIGIYIPDDPKYKYPGEFLGGIRTEPWGTRRESPKTTLDLRIEKRFRIGEGMTIGGYLDIMNFAGRSGYDIESNPGGHLDYNDPNNPTFIRRGTYGVMDNAYGNRIFKVSLRFTF